MLFDLSAHFLPLAIPVPGYQSDMLVLLHRLWPPHMLFEHNQSLPTAAYLNRIPLLSGLAVLLLLQAELPSSMVGNYFRSRLVDQCRIPAID
jgi:hypothetical protein